MAILSRYYLVFLFGIIQFYFCNDYAKMNPIIGLLSIDIYLPEAQNLKEKRAILKSLLKRIHNTFNVSAAEIDKHDKWQVAVIAITVVSNHAKQSEKVLRECIDWIENNYPQVQLIREEIEII